MRLGVLASHPIQYDAPLHRELARRADVMVYFAFRPDAQAQGAGFDRAFTWDVNLLDDYPHEFLPNLARRPSADYFLGCHTPAIRDRIRGGRFKAFVMSGWFLRSHWQAIRACRRAGVPLLVRGDSHLRTPRRPVTRVLQAMLYPCMLRAFEGFLSMSTRNAEFLRRHGVPAGRIHPCPHFVDNAWWAGKAAEAAPSRHTTRARWGAEKMTFVVLFAGKFLALKRVEDILRAVKHLGSMGVPARLVCVGSGPEEESLRAAARAWEVPAFFDGFRNQSELPACYAAAEVLVLSSSSETWGLVVNEAMACGLPAVVSDVVGCAPDLIDPGVTGFTYPVGDTEALAARLGDIAAMRRRGHHFAPALSAKLSLFTVARAAECILSAAQSLAWHRPRRSPAAR